ncbi:MAG: hypothetical protein RR443_00140 [Anaerorhabdus sp.]|uniref:Ig-like domain-containing protein n=1 Tax=Anaerorhabdus sp. TaxID=1872524 RepID=UPI002FCA52B9
MRMRQISKALQIILCIFMFVNVGCSKKVESITVGEWLEKIVINANIPESTKSNPYFLNIKEDNQYFSYVQASVEWGILDTTQPIDVDSLLTKEFVAYTLVNLMHEELNAAATKDASKSNFPEHCAKSISLGIFQTDKRGMFNPLEKVDRVLADEKLNLVLGYINNYDSKDITQIDLNEEIIEAEIPIEFNESEKIIRYQDEVNFNEKDIIHWNDGEDQYFRVEKIKKSEEFTEVQLSEVDYFELFNNVEVDGSFEIDFSNASITSSFEEINPNEYKIDKMVLKEFQLGDLSGTFNVDNEGIQVKIKKKQKYGELVSEIKLYKVKPTIRWKTSSNMIEDAYFKLDFSTLESIKYHNTKFKNYYSDFKNFEGKDLVTKIVNTFHESEEMDGVLIPICDIQVPIPNVPVLTLGMKLQLHLYASGKIEIVLTNQHQIGLEIRNNKLRTFSNNERDLDFIMKASANSTLGFTTSLKAANIHLIDIGIKGGIEGSVATTVHLYDKNGEITTTKINAPLDIVDESTITRDDVKVCGDIKANLLLDITVNSKKTLASKLGLSKTWNVLNNSNASIIPSKRTHLENWQFLERCTRLKRKKQHEKEIITADKIVLERVNYLIKIDESKLITIKGLPTEYSNSDLIYETINPEICSIATNGEVKGIQKGSCTISIKTNDNKYSTLCHVLVS